MARRLDTLDASCRRTRGSAWSSSGGACPTSCSRCCSVPATPSVTTYSDNVVRAFIKRSADNGTDVFRIFDSLNSTDNMQLAIDAVRTDTNALCEAAICYTGTSSIPRGRALYSLDYYVRMAKRLVAMGASSASRTWPGCASRMRRAPYAAARRDRRADSLPHARYERHQRGRILRAADAGVDIADAAIASMSGMTSQPSLNGIVAALRHTERDTGLDLEALDGLSRYWAAVRELYYPFEEGLQAPSADVYQHEMPGGQFTNLRQQARTLGLEGRWEDVPGLCRSQSAVRRHRQGDAVEQGRRRPCAVHGHQRSERERRPDRARALNFPRSVVEMMQGLLGEPEGGWPKRFQEIVLRSARVEPISGRLGRHCRRRTYGGRPLKSEEDEARAARRGTSCRTCVLRRFTSTTSITSRNLQDTSAIPTTSFFYGLQSGEEIAVEIERADAHRAVSDDRRGPRGRHADGVLRAQWTAAGGSRSGSVGREPQRHPKGDPDNAEPRRRAHARQGRAVLHARPGISTKRTPAVDRSDEDGDGLHGSRVTRPSSRCWSSRCRCRSAGPARHLEVVQKQQVASRSIFAVD